MDLWQSELWMGLMQIAFLAVVMLIANTIRRKVGFMRKSLLPTAVIAGFLALALKYIIYWIFDDGSFINEEFMTAVTYHTLGIGFIALTLKAAEKTPDKTQKARAVKSGFFIVATYAMQCALGILLTFCMTKAFFPNLFEASGVLLMLGFGQGPGQAGNIGKVYEGLGFVGGQSFGLAVASLGFIWACIGGVIYVNIMLRKKKISKPEHTPPDQLAVSSFVDENEIPHSEAIDKMSVQLCFVLLVYALTYLFMYGINALVETDALGHFGYETLRPLVWGFNFLWATLIALLVKMVIRFLHKTGLMHRQYTNNYLMNRVGGLAFDFMILASICAINIRDLSANNLMVPLFVLSFIGGFATLFYILWLAKRAYPDYPYEGILSMYGMLTGTVSTGMILLREIDPEFKTPAANNLVYGSTSAVAVGAPLLLIITLATKHLWLFFGIVMAVFVLYTAIVYFSIDLRKVFGKKGGTAGGSGDAGGAEPPATE